MRDKVGITQTCLDYKVIRTLGVIINSIRYYNFKKKDIFNAMWNKLD